jgi:hypothetical protein
MQAVPTSGNATADETEDLEIREFFAVALTEPELRAWEDDPYVHLEVGYYLTPSGPYTRAVLRFYDQLKSHGANMWRGARFSVTVQRDGRDGRDWHPTAYRVLACSPPDSD